MSCTYCCTRQRDLATCACGNSVCGTCFYPRTSVSLFRKMVSNSGRGGLPYACDVCCDARSYHPLCLVCEQGSDGGDLVKCSSCRGAFHRACHQQNRCPHCIKAVCTLGAHVLESWCVELYGKVAGSCIRVVGTLRGEGPTQGYQSSHIIHAIESREGSIVICRDVVVHLSGSMCPRAASISRLPGIIVRYFKDGFPSDWKRILRALQSEARLPSSPGTPSPRNNVTSVVERVRARTQHNTEKTQVPASLALLLRDSSPAAQMHDPIDSRSFSTQSGERRTSTSLPSRVPHDSVESFSRSSSSAPKAQPLPAPRTHSHAETQRPVPSNLLRVPEQQSRRRRLSKAPAEKSVCVIQVPSPAAASTDLRGAENRAPPFSNLPVTPCFGCDAVPASTGGKSDHDDGHVACNTDAQSLGAGLESQLPLVEASSIRKESKATSLDAADVVVIDPPDSPAQPPKGGITLVVDVELPTDMTSDGDLAEGTHTRKDTIEAAQSPRLSRPSLQSSSRAKLRVNLAKNRQVRRSSRITLSSSSATLPRVGRYSSSWSIPDAQPSRPTTDSASRQPSDVTAEKDRPSDGNSKEQSLLSRSHTTLPLTYTYGAMSCSSDTAPCSVSAWRSSLPCEPIMLNCRTGPSFPPTPESFHESCVHSQPLERLHAPTQDIGTQTQDMSAMTVCTNQEVVLGDIVPEQRATEVKVYEELVDIDSLRLYVRSKVDRRQSQAEEFLRMAEKAARGQVDESIRRIPMTYHRSADMGRRYADQNPSLQSVTRECRAAACGSLLCDIDISNCYPVLITQMVDKCTKQQGLPPLELGVLRHYVTSEGRADMLHAVMQRYDVSRDVAKKLFLRLLYGGTVHKWRTENGIDSAPDLAVVWAFRREALNAATLIVRSRPHLVYRFLSRRESNDAAEKCALAYILGEAEDMIISTCESILEQRGIPVSVVVFDGLMIDMSSVTEEVLVPALRQARNEIKTKLGYSVNFECKMLVGCAMQARVGGSANDIRLARRYDEEIARLKQWKYDMLYKQLQEKRKAKAKASNRKGSVRLSRAPRKKIAANRAAGAPLTGEEATRFRTSMGKLNSRDPNFWFLLSSRVERSVEDCKAHYALQKRRRKEGRTASPPSQSLGDVPASFPSVSDSVPTTSVVCVDDFKSHLSERVSVATSTHSVAEEVFVVDPDRHANAHGKKRGCGDALRHHKRTREGSGPASSRSRHRRLSFETPKKRRRVSSSFGSDLRRKVLKP